MKASTCLICVSRLEGSWSPSRHFFSRIQLPFFLWDRNVPVSRCSYLIQNFRSLIFSDATNLTLISSIQFLSPFVDSLGVSSIDSIKYPKNSLRLPKKSTRGCFKKVLNHWITEFFRGSLCSFKMGSISLINCSNSGLNLSRSIFPTNSSKFFFYFPSSCRPASCICVSSIFNTLKTTSIKSFNL